MTTTHLVRIPINIGSLARWAAERGWAEIRGTAFDEGRAIHHLVTETLGPNIIHCFRLLVPPRRSLGNLYAYSQLSAETLCASVRNHALPDHLDVLSLDGLVSKPMPQSWRSGQRIGFDVRVRPVRRLASPLRVRQETIEAGSEIDVFLHEAWREHADAPDCMTSKGRTREAVYLDWLAARLTKAARVIVQQAVWCNFAVFALYEGKKYRGSRCNSTGSAGSSRPGSIFRVYFAWRRKA